MIIARKIIPVFILLLNVSNTVFADAKFEGQQFLFILEEAYTQEKGEWEISVSPQYWDGKKLREVDFDGSSREDELVIRDQFLFVTEIEYGMTENFQLAIEVPFEFFDETKIEEDGNKTITDNAGLGDISFEVKYKIFEEVLDDSWLPTTSIGVEVVLPTGDWGEGLGTSRFEFEGGIALSKTFERFVFHGNIRGGVTGDARELGETGRSDELETSGGIAMVYHLAEDIDFINELSFEYEVEKNDGNENYETQIYYTPGIAMEFKEGLEVGLGVPVGLTYESYNWGVISKILIEW